MLCVSFYFSIKSLLVQDQHQVCSLRRSDLLTQYIEERQSSSCQLILDLKKKCNIKILRFRGDRKEELVISGRLSGVVSEKGELTLAWILSRGEGGLTSGYP